MKEKQAARKQGQPITKADNKTPQLPAESFFRFLFQKTQRNEFLVIITGMIILYYIIGMLYPIPAWNADSANYLYSAEVGTFGGYRPFGYSWFLILVKKFAPTTGAVYFFQYWFNAIASLSFIFTIKYIFRPANKWVYYCFAYFTLVSPAVLYLTDYILSDSIFISLTILWITSCVWILHNRSIAAIVLHAFTFWGALHVRYSALFYPVFSLAVFFIAFKHRKMVAVALSIIPVLISIQVYNYNVSKMKKLVNVGIFSGFSGWVLANNAVHILPWIDLKAEDIEDPEVKRIHTLARELPDSVYIKNGISSFYMWEKEYPFKKYMYKRLEESQLPYLNCWVLTSIDFGKYGNLLIKKYPGQFLMHYLLPNTWQAINPPVGATYEFASYSITPADNKWFVQKPEDYVQPKNPVISTVFSPILPALVFVQWILVAIAIVLTAIYRKRMALTATQWLIFFLMIGFIITYMAANIYGAPFFIRYVLPIHCMQTLLIFIPLFGLFRKKEIKA